MHANRSSENVFKTVGIVGLGLIGGSLAKAFRAFAGIERIVVADVDRDATRRALEEGCADAVVDLSAPDFVQAFAGCDILFVCVPPQAACELLPRFVGADIGIVTDVASVKTPILCAAAGLGNFIGGHPMAGSEGSGYESADANLFQGTTYVMCVPEGTALRPVDVDAYKCLVAAIGARPVAMDPVEHDRRVAVISHLPHAAAFALALMVESSHDVEMRMLIGGGFRDTTRISASSPSLWADIMQASSPLVSAIDEYVSLLCRMRDLLTSGQRDGLRDLLKTASDFRASIPEGLHAAKHGDREP